VSIAVQSGVEVTDAPGEPRQRVSQAFCSALPVACTAVPSRHWKAFASPVLEAAYEATMWAAVLNSARGASNVVLLTSLGGGAFGNDEDWTLAFNRPDRAPAELARSRSVWSETTSRSPTP